MDETEINLLALEWNICQLERVQMNIRNAEKHTTPMEIEPTNHRAYRQTLLLCATLVLKIF